MSPLFTHLCPPLNLSWTEDILSFPPIRCRGPFPPVPSGTPRDPVLKGPPSFYVSEVPSFFVVTPHYRPPTRVRDVRLFSSSEELRKNGKSAIMLRCGNTHTPSVTVSVVPRTKRRGTGSTLLNTSLVVFISGNSERLTPFLLSSVGLYF